MEDYTHWSVATSLVKLAIYISSFMAGGSLLFLFALRPSDKELINRLRRLSMISAFVAIIVSVLRIMVQAGRLMDDGWVGMIDIEIIGFSLEGPLGLSTYLRLAGLALVILAAVFSRLRPSAGLIGAILVALSFALTGHATRDPQQLLLTLLTVHLLAVSYWFGALVPLHYLSGEGKDFRYAAEISENFGKQATIVVPILMLVGIMFAYLVVGSWTNLFSTNYGWALITKLGVVSCVLIIATANKLRHVPALLTGGKAQARAFRRSLQIELALFILVFAITAVLTATFTLPEEDIL